EFKLTIADTGPTPFGYWCGGPGMFPSAEPFTAIIRDASGQTIEAQLENGQYIMGSGMGRQIDKTVSLPAWCAPLPAGEYTITIRGRAKRHTVDPASAIIWPAMEAKPIALRVMDDRDALETAEKEFVAQAKPYNNIYYIAIRYGLHPNVLSDLR